MAIPLASLHFSVADIRFSENAGAGLDPPEPAATSRQNP
jgi:hypothetical protein